MENRSQSGADNIASISYLCCDWQWGDCVQFAAFSKSIKTAETGLIFVNRETVHPVAGLASVGAQLVGNMRYMGNL